MIEHKEGQKNITATAETTTTSKMRIVIAVLVVVIVSTSFYSYKTYKENKEGIMTYVSQALDTILLPYKIAKLTSEPEDTTIPIPIQGIKKSGIADTWGDARSGGRKHEGTDIFAKRGTPIFAVTNGFVMRVGQSGLGGNYIYTIGPGGVRYYYAHLDRVAEGIKAGAPVTTDTVIGFVGNTGNAITTPPHLHFGIYKNGAQNPYPYFTD